jgi:hypothetical protein
VALDKKYCNDEEERNMPLSVIGAGVGRTGTLSLKLALERLGFGPCYHMIEVFGHLDDHVPIWDRAANGERIGWEALFEEYQSAVDFPAAAFYRELAEYYPNAKVILTVRDSHRWLKSFNDTIRHPISEPLPDRLAVWGEMVRKAVLNRVFDGKVADDAHVVASYERHNVMVKRTIPPVRLLVYEVSQGWGPLCEFLRVPVPDEPFPKLNSTAEWRARISSMFRREPSA